MIIPEARLDLIGNYPVLFFIPVIDAGSFDSKKSFYSSMWCTSGLQLETLSKTQ